MENDLFPFPVAELHRFYSSLLEIFFGKDPRRLAVAEKEHGERVSGVDILVQKELFKFLLPFYPGYLFIGEEKTPGKKVSELTWPPNSGRLCLADPLDGTHDYLMGAPMFGSMFAEFDEFRPVASAIFLPSRFLENHGGLFVAARGKGAYEYYNNGRKPRRLRVSAQADLQRATVLFEAPRHRRAARIFRLAERKAHRTRRFGSTAYSATLVADGGNYRLGADALIVVRNQPWDIFPTALLVTEAGGKVTDERGQPLTLTTHSAIFSNGRLHRPLVALSSLKRHQARSPR